MKTIKARFNHGRWIWDCPKCNTGNTISPGQKLAICGDCWPGKRALKEAVINGVIVRGVDKLRQDTAKRMAMAQGEVYKISFPKDHAAIEEVLRARKTEHQSWEVGETVEDLKAENDTHPLLGYLKKKTVKKKPEPVKTVELADIDEKTLRRIY